MHLAALAAGLATLYTVTAFLIPPASSLPHAEEPHKSPSVFGTDVNWDIELPCPHCPWAGLEEINGTQTQWSREHETSLLLTISASPSTGLLVNHVTALAPPHSHADTSANTLPILLAPQKLVSTAATSQPYPLDFILERLPAITSPSNPHVFLLPLKLTIVGFAGQPVKVDTLSVDLLAGPGRLSVMRVRKVPFSETPGARECEGIEEGRWSLCRVKAIVRHRVLETVRAMRKGAEQAKGWVKGGCHGGMRREQMGGYHAYGYGHAGHRAHRWAKMLHSTLRFFVIPALLGVIGGLLASAVGMLVGQGIVWLWLRVFRNGCQQAARSQYVDEKRGLSGAEAEVLDEEGDEEALPKYEDGGKLPEYEDVESQAGESRQ